MEIVIIIIIIVFLEEKKIKTDISQPSLLFMGRT